MTAPFRIFIGWDQREPEAYDVAKFSLERRASIPVEVAPIKLDELRARGLYWRDQDPLASTEFTYSRFLTPALAGFKGWALFCDCDFLWLGDIAGLPQYTKSPKAVYCVQHDYTPKETTKMDGAVQTAYPRKNWSSLMLFNCDHPAVRSLTPEVVNRESGAYLHRMQWVGRRGHRRAAGRMELAGRLERKAGAGHAERRAFHPRRPLVRAIGRTSTTATCGAPSAMP